jgi:dGTPase
MAIDLYRCAVTGDADDLLLTRVHPAPSRPARTAFQRDRERIVQARAFRRLAGKTQVFTSRASDHFRSRLTHTIEVAQIARAAASTLGLNEDLAETLALVHDIGHPPFGHAGERALDRCLTRHGRRFDHNLHALRIVEHFEQRYAAPRAQSDARCSRRHHRARVTTRPNSIRAGGYLLDEAAARGSVDDLLTRSQYLWADLDDGVSRDCSRSVIFATTSTSSGVVIAWWKENTPGVRSSVQRGVAEMQNVLTMI